MKSETRTSTVIKRILLGVSTRTFFMDGIHTKLNGASVKNVRVIGPGDPPSGQQVQNPPFVLTPSLRPLSVYT